MLSGPFARKDAFLGPWTGKTIKDWSPGVRKRERSILAEVRKADRAAIAEIEQLLASLKK